MEQTITEILRLKNALADEKKLPSGCAYLTEDIILSYPQADGNARYPYACDGLTLWAYTAGEMTANESKFNVFPDTTCGREPRIAFFTGERNGKEYVPVSVTGAARRGAEKTVERFTVYTPQAAYYFADTPKTLSVLCAYVGKDKTLCFKHYVNNKTNKPLELYSSAYFAPLMTNGDNEGFWDKLYRRGDITEYGYLLTATEFVADRTIEHYLAVTTDGNAEYRTTSRGVYNGGLNRQLSASLPLADGKWTRNKPTTAFSETAIVGELTPFTLEAGGAKTTSYRIILSDDIADIRTRVRDRIDPAPSVTGGEHGKTFAFEKAYGAFSKYDGVFAPFMNGVVRQVEFCTTSKCYAGAMIGMRDIFQQIEGAIPTMPDYCRKKIVEALGYIGESGRVPRQYSYPRDAATPPAMDLREYIDQGVWIISTVYMYLKYTDDFSILDEQCGYYDIADNKVGLSKKRNGVLEHLLAIADYLISNIDADTDCLKALFGDWNDALDGLGRTDKPNAKFGNGVSVMASLQLYRNLGELVEILKTTGKFADKSVEYENARTRLKRGLENNAVKNNKILHGWGDDRRWFVGSDSDCDGKKRDGLTANAFWVLSGMYNDSDGISKADILNAYDRLDGKYGLKTFEPYFETNCKEVGRLSRLPKGTAENGATYIHATLFGILSLFEMGESERAWAQLYKVLPFTHGYISTSPFVMSNSYAENSELDVDGQSISDWFTGSGCVLLKSLYGGVFGIKPTADGVEIKPALDLPFKKAECTVMLKGKRVTVRLAKGSGKNNRAFVPTSELFDGAVIEVGA